MVRKCKHKFVKAIELKSNRMINVCKYCDKIIRPIKSKKGGVGLQWIFMSLVVFVGIVTLSLYAYTNLMKDNGGTIDSAFLSKYTNITSRAPGLTTQSGNFYINALKELPSAVGSLIMTVLTMGITSIQTLATATSSTKDVIEGIGSVFPELQVVFWVFTTMLAVYIAFRFIQSARGSIVEA